jgi:hypothetical protein
MLPQQFEAFVPHFGILINYLFINLEGNIKDSSVYDLFKGLIEGFLSYVHDKNLKIDDAILNDVRKLLGLLEMKKGSVIWTISRFENFLILVIYLQQGMLPWKSLLLNL